MTDPVLTLREVARYLRVHSNTIYRLAQRGDLPAFKVGSDWRFNRESIDRWRLEQERAPGPSPIGQEILDIAYWYLMEALQPLVTLNDLRVFTGWKQKVAAREIDRLVQSGFLTSEGVSPDEKYSLTPRGMSRAERSRPEISGHGAVLDLHRMGGTA